MTNTAREFQSIGSDLWQATDTDDVIISLNSAGTMFTVESSDSVQDFYVTGRVQDAFELAQAYARSI